MIHGILAVSLFALQGEGIQKRAEALAFNTKILDSKHNPRVLNDTLPEIDKIRERIKRLENAKNQLEVEYKKLDKEKTPKKQLVDLESKIQLTGEMIELLKSIVK
jgi:predicted nuclease with TOPRIM domain